MHMLKALAAGLIVGVIVTEALLAAIGVLAGNPGLPEDLAAGQPLPGMHLVAVATAWLVGSTLAGAMSTAMSGFRLLGWVVGGLLCLPTLLILVLAGFPWAVVGIGLLPAAGAIAGAAIALRVSPA